MKLAIIDRNSGEQRTIDPTTNGAEFFAEIRRLAEWVEKPLPDVQDQLASGLTLNTALHTYTLVD